MWNPTLIKKGISDKYVHRVLECYVLGVIDLSRGETPSGDATVGRNDRNSVKMRNAYKQGSYRDDFTNSTKETKNLIDFSKTGEMLELFGIDFPFRNDKKSAGISYPGCQGLFKRGFRFRSSRYH